MCRATHRSYSVPSRESTGPGVEGTLYVGDTRASGEGSPRGGFLGARGGLTGCAGAPCEFI